MKRTHTFISRNRNMYLLDIPTKLLLFIHPIMHSIQTGIKPKEIDIKLLDTDTTYYIKKLDFISKMLLEKTNQNSENTPNLTSMISPERIKANLINLRQITFEVTDSCNLKCKYCGYGEFYNNYDPRNNTYMPYSYATNILDYLLNLWADNKYRHYHRNIAISFYGGEPLMGIQFIKKVVSYVEQIKLAGHTFTFSMTTNGTLLEKHIKYLVEKKFDLTISLDGNKTNNSYRTFHNGKPSYEILIHTLKTIQNQYRDYFENNIQFNAVLHNRNSVDEIHQYFKKEFNKTPNISEVGASGINQDRREEFIKIFQNWRSSLREAKNENMIISDMEYSGPAKLLHSFLSLYSGNIYEKYNDILANQSSKVFLPTGTCMPFSRKMFVSVSGKIFPCERIGHQFALGKVSSEDIDLDVAAIAEKYRTYYEKLVESCKHCYGHRDCMKCMFNLKWLNNIPQCDDIIAEPDFKSQLSERITSLENAPKLYEMIMNDWLIA